LDIFQAIILGIVEGATEFLPISSTGHMIVVADWLGMKQTEANTAFEVIIQLAAILAVVFNYKEKFTLQKIDLWTKVFVAFLPIGIVGFIFSHQVKALFSVPVVATMFIVGGIIFLILEYFYKAQNHTTTDVEQVTMKQALWIGVAQVFALIPGTSRAGSTIVGALLVGLSRKAAAEFFLAKKYVANQQVEAHDDGSLTVTATVSTKADVDDIIKSWLPHIEILEPKEYRDAFEEEMRDYLERVYG